MKTPRYEGMAALVMNPSLSRVSLPRRYCSVEAIPKRGKAGIPSLIANRNDVKVGRSGLFPKGCLWQNPYLYGSIRSIR